MCDCDPTRRRFLTVAGAAAGALVAGWSSAQLSQAVSVPPVDGPAQSSGDGPFVSSLRVNRRAAWGADLPVKGPLVGEESRFILVHHTASPNDRRNPRDLVRVTHAYHTGPKGWPDVAYNFMIGHDGSVWEARQGSLAAPVVADATGGSQGYAQLICLIGNFSTAPPTAAMQRSLVELIAFLAARDGIDLSPRSSTTFTSRGSNKFPAGSRITTSTVSGHRDCSYTACPGDVAYRMIPSWKQRAHALLSSGGGTYFPAERLGRSGS